MPLLRPFVCYPKRAAANGTPRVSRPPSDPRSPPRWTSSSVG